MPPTCRTPHDDEIATGTWPRGVSSRFEDTFDMVDGRVKIDEGRLGSDRSLTCFSRDWEAKEGFGGKRKSRRVESENEEAASVVEGCAVSSRGNGEIELEEATDASEGDSQL